MTKSKKVLIALGLFVGLFVVVGITTPPVDPVKVKEQKIADAKEKIVNECVAQKMQSYKARKTAETAIALKLHMADKDHLIKHISTQDAIKAVYCNESDLKIKVDGMKITYTMVE